MPTPIRMSQLHYILLTFLSLAVPYLNNQWKHYQESQVDMDRMLPLFYTAIERYPDLRARLPAPAHSHPQGMYSAKPLFYEHDGIQPFWNLGLAMPPN